MSLTPQLLAGSLLAIASGLAYWAVGAHYARRATRAAWPRALFALFWMGVGFFGITDGAWSLLVATTNPPLTLGIVILHLKLLLGITGFYGLVAFVLYIYRGTRTPLILAAAAYAAIYAIAATSYITAQPVGQELQLWRAGLIYANPGGPLSTLTTILLFLPPATAAIAYACLAPRTANPRQRRRVQTTSLAIATFLASVLVAWLIGPAPWWPPVEKVLGLTTAMVAWVALRRAEGEE